MGLEMKRERSLVGRRVGVGEVLGYGGGGGEYSSV